MNEKLLRRLGDILREPRETLDVELKGWLDIQGKNRDKAVLAKSVVALANHGGGIVILGFAETSKGVIEAKDRPQNLSAYTPDTVNSVVNRYIEPPFHCDIRIVDSPDGRSYPVVIVPGGHQFPVRSKRAGPNGNDLTANTYYIRRPGPMSEPPQSAVEWDILIRRCIANARDLLFDQFRQLMTGGAPTVEEPESDLESTRQWLLGSFNRWENVVGDLPVDQGARFPHGHYAFAFQLFSDDLVPKSGSELLEALRRSVGRYTGWPPFWVPSRAGIAPYMRDGCIECWLGGEDGDSAHSDFWRVSPDAKFFLIRGFQEDNQPQEKLPSGKGFDLTLPTWRTGELLLYAGKVASELGIPQARVMLIAEWVGLRDRELISFGFPSWPLTEGRVSHEDRFEGVIAVPADEISTFLPEFVERIIRPLYELFGFYQLPAQLVQREMTRMKEGR